MLLNRPFARMIGAALVLTLVACGGDRAAPTAVSAEIAPSSAALQATLASEEVRISNNALAAARAGYVADDLVSSANSLLVQCSPLPYSAQTRIIGSAGGTLKAGPHTLVIPKGALKSNTVITMEAPVSSYAEVKFSPHGLQFTAKAKPALTLSYAHCNGVLSNVAKRIVYVDGLKILESLLSLDSPKTKTVRADLSHFSSYMVAY